MKILIAVFEGLNAPETDALRIKRFWNAKYQDWTETEKDATFYEDDHDEKIENETGLPPTSSTNARAASKEVFTELIKQHPSKAWSCEFHWEHAPEKTA